MKIFLGILYFGLCRILQEKKEETKYKSGHFFNLKYKILK